MFQATNFIPEMYSEYLIQLVWLHLLPCMYMCIHTSSPQLSICVREPTASAAVVTEVQFSHYKRVKICETDLMPNCSDAHHYQHHGGSVTAKCDCDVIESVTSRYWYALGSELSANQKSPDTFGEQISASLIGLATANISRRIFHVAVLVCI